MRCYFILLPTLFLLLPFGIAAQTKARIHSSAEILKVMEDSKIVYEISILDSTFPCREHDNVLKEDNAFPSKAKESVNGYETYKLSRSEAAIFGKGEELFSVGQYPEAREQYLELARLRPDFAPAFVYASQTFEKVEDYSNAIKCEEQAIAANYYSYLAHYFVADDYEMIGNHKKAAEEIVTASILNRNNKNIRKAMERIMPNAGYKLSTWCFEPQVLIMRNDDAHISLQFADSWLGYAVAKAVWKFEPGYRASNGGAQEGAYNLNEDKECLASLAAGLENDTERRWQKSPELTALMKAIDGKMFTEYLLYEVMLPKFPRAVLQLSRAELDDVRKYFFLARVK